MVHDVFISYSSDDKPIADRICHGLEERGVRCWITPRDVGYGADWQTAIMDALASAKAVILVFTHNTNKSVHVRREVTAALESGAIVIPFRTEDAVPEGALKYNLINVHWLDAFAPPLDQHIERLIETIQRLTTPGAPPPLPSPPPGPSPDPIPPPPPPPLPPPPPPPDPGPEKPWDDLPLDRRANLITALALVLGALAIFSPWWLLAAPLGVALAWRRNYEHRAGAAVQTTQNRAIAVTIGTVLVAILATVIGVSLRGPHPTPTPAPAPSPAPAIPTTPSDRYKITIQNQTGQTVKNLYASASNAAWNDVDLLGSGVLSAGNSITLNLDNGSGQCDWDFKAKFDDNSDIRRYHIDVCTTSTYPLVMDSTSSSSNSSSVPPSGRFVMGIENDTGKEIRNLYVSAVGAPWNNNDVLGSSVLNAGQSVRLNFDNGSGQCAWDVKAVYSDSTEAEAFNIDVCTTSTYHFNG